MTELKPAVDLTAGPTWPTVRLAIFDLDGVLVDVQPAENAALAHLAELMGVQLTSDEANAMFSGHKLQHCIDLITRLARHDPPGDAVEIVRVRCDEIIGPTLEPIAGVREALDEITVPKCVASNSPRDIINTRLRLAGLHSCFNGRVFSAYDIAAWKPDPRLFLWAANAMGFAANDTLVIEDSVVGVAAGVAAGMRVAQFCREATASEDAAMAFSDMHLLPELIEQGGIAWQQLGKSR